MSTKITIFTVKKGDLDTPQNVHFQLVCAEDRETFRAVQGTKSLYTLVCGAETPKDNPPW